MGAWFNVFRIHSGGEVNLLLPPKEKKMHDCAANKRALDEIGR
jgi:hypothetical protein